MATLSAASVRLSATANCAQESLTFLPVRKTLRTSKISPLPAETNSARNWRAASLIATPFQQSRQSPSGALVTSSTPHSRHKDVSDMIADYPVLTCFQTH